MAKRDKEKKKENMVDHSSNSTYAYMQTSMHISVYGMHTWYTCILVYICIYGIYSWYI